MQMKVNMQWVAVAHVGPDISPIENYINCPVRQVRLIFNHSVHIHKLQDWLQVSIRPSLFFILEFLFLLL